MGLNERGLVISCPIRAERDGSFTPYVAWDDQELRFALLFWDKLDAPDSNITSIGTENREIAPLRDLGVLKSTRVEMAMPRAPAAKDLAGLVLRARTRAFEILDTNEPGVWSVEAGDHSVSFQASDLHAGGGAFIRLYGAIPVPASSVPFGAILEFKAKRRAELLALRYQLDALYRSVHAAGDGDLALDSEIAQLERTISDYIRVARDSRIPFVEGNFEAGLNVLRLPGGPVTATATWHLGAVRALLAGQTSFLSIGPGDSLKRKEPSTTPFRYISSFDKRLF